MRAKLTRELHRVTTLRVPQLFPEAEVKIFEPLPDKFIRNLLRDLPLEEARTRSREIEALPDGCLCWVLNPKSQFRFYVILLASPKDDSFTFEIGWNKRGRLPRSRINSPDEARDQDESCLRVGRFWDAQIYEDWWYFGRRRTPPEIVSGVPDDPLDIKLADVEPKVNDALAKLKHYAVPYLCGVAEKHGITLLTR